MNTSEPISYKYLNTISKEELLGLELPNEILVAHIMNLRKELEELKEDNKVTDEKIKIYGEVLTNG